MQVSRLRVWERQLIRALPENLHLSYARSAAHWKTTIDNEGEMTMDRQRVREREAQCIQEWPPTCTATCPIHVDVRGMIAAIRKGDLATAFSAFNRIAPFPRIISRICDHPCQKACKRIEAGEAIEIRALERACVEHSSVSQIRRLPKKDKRIAVVGAGLSGLTAALDLATKGFVLVIFESRDRLAGRIRALGEAVLPQHEITSDLEVFEKLGVEVRYNSAVGNAPDSAVRFDSLVEEFDAVYLGLGPASVAPLQLDLEVREDGHLAIDPLTFATSHPKVFAGGSQRYSLAEYSPITSIQEGRAASLSIERLLQNASLTVNRETQGSYQTKLYTKTTDIPPLPAVQVPITGYTKKEALQESERCLLCECMECVKVCEYLAHYKSYPKRYIRQIFNNDSIIMGPRSLNRMIDSCALCGLCEAVCPEKLSMGEVCLEARQSMVAAGKMPASHHDFALRDMAFSTGEKFALAQHQPGFTSSSAVFYPGCQLSGSSPEQVARVYEHLRQTISGGVGLVLGCCGAPAAWAGQQELFGKTLAAFSEQWKQMGSPQVITACSSCYRMFKDNLPDLPLESLWTVLDRVGLPQSTSAKVNTVAIHDPCTTRYDTDIQDSVRHILAKLAVPVDELESRRKETTCCGYGGLMWSVNHELADKTVDRRIKESNADYVTYCAMCRDNFAARGKRSLHMLDLICGDGADPAARKRTTYSERHENRARLKNRLLHELWGENMANEEQSLKLSISPEVLELMEQRMILVEDVQKVIAHAETTGEKLLNAETGRFLASYRPAAVTYWVEYSAQNEEFTVHNVYSHRMEIK